ncbi:MAG: class I SAM-dependent methyltransferase [Legionellaceae bacterium]|nr:class I SAM-dependent methyltransferase [Legionellaceae bacterium]
MANIASVSYTTQAKYSQAEFLAKELNVPLGDTDDSRFPRLEVSAAGLALCMQDCLPMHIDFQALVSESLQSEQTQKALLRACGAESGMRVIDATAGWGQDAVMLASSGADVIMLEPEPVLAALLEDGLQRLSDQGDASLNLALHAFDARSYLEALTPADYPDIIYMDPLHLTPHKKNYPVLKEFLAADEDPLSLLEIARSRVKNRVVVKWPTRAQPLLNPTYVLEGKTVRFDAYLPSSS